MVARKVDLACVANSASARAASAASFAAAARPAFAQFRDVVIDAEQAAVLELPENVFDVTAAIGAPLVAVAAGLAHPRGDFGDLGVDVEVVERSILATRDGVTDQLQGGIARLNLVRRIAVLLAVVTIAEHPAEILVEQRNAVAQIVEHGLHDLVRALDLVARGLGRLLRGASACRGL